jgi:DNA replication protein DnaC
MISVDKLPLRRKTWTKIANIPRARLGWELSDCKAITAPDLKLIRSWISKVKDGSVIRADGKATCGKGLLFVGSPGHGKSTLALAMIQEMIRELTLDAFSVSEGKSLVMPCYFATFNDIVDLKGELMGEYTPEQERLFLGMHGECKDDAYNIRVLVVDDVGKEHASGSGWQRTMLHHILRTRFNNGLPTIVTTNLPVKAWISNYGDATGSFIHEAFVTIELESIEGDLRSR